MKNIKIILIILIGIVLLVIPALVLADNGIKIPFIPFIDPHIEEAEREQNLLEEKAMIANQLMESNTIDMSSEKSSEPLEIPNNTDTKEKENRIKKIIDKYYKEEFAEIEQRIEQESESKGLDNEHPMFDAEIELFELIVKIIETKPLSDDEIADLKELLNDNLDRIQAYENLKQKVMKVLE